MTYVNKDDLKAFSGKYLEEGEGVDILQTCLDAAAQQVRLYLGYDLEAKDHKAIMLGNDSDTLALYARPIISISLIKEGGVQEAELDVGDIITFDNYARSMHGNIFKKEKVYTIVYRAGYSAVPGDIKLTTLQIASLMLESSQGNLATSSTTYADSGSRTFNNWSLDRFLKQLDRYRIYAGYVGTGADTVLEAEEASDGIIGS